MENEITKVETAQERAIMLNGRINANAKIAAESMAKVGHDLKAMRDEKLYLELGCKTFEEFCDTRTPIGQRQSYNFIRCFETFGERLAELADIGVTKLALMAALDDEDSEILIESGDAENLSVSQLKERIRELKKKNEQLTLELDAFDKSDGGSDEDLKAENERLAGELDATKAILETRREEDDQREKELEKREAALKESNEALLKAQKELEAVKAASKEQRHLAEKTEIELRDRVNALEQSNEQLAARPVDIAVEKPSADEIAKIEKAAAEKAEKAAKKQHAAEIKKLREELAQKAEQERITAVDAARRESAAEIERLRSEKEILQSSAKKAPPSAEKERVKFHIEECTRSFNAALESLFALPEDEREKPEKAMKNMVDKMRSLLEEDNS